MRFSVFENHEALSARAAEIIEPLEHDLDRPGVTSNQAMVWHSLKKLGIKDRVPGYGRLMAATGNG